MIKPVKYFLILGLLFLFFVDDCSFMGGDVQQLKTNLGNLKLSLTKLKRELGTLQSKLGELKDKLKGTAPQPLPHPGPQPVPRPAPQPQPHPIPVPQLKPVQPQAVNPWQQIVTFFEGNFGNPAVAQLPKQPVWDSMIAAIKAGNIDEVYRLMSVFGSSSVKTRKDKSLLAIAKFHLSQHPSGVQPGPQPVPLAQNLRPIAATTPVWLRINNILKDQKSRNLWNPAKLAIRFYFPANLNIKTPQTADYYIKTPQTADYYGNYFSNYSNHRVTIAGETFATTEHYFQAQKVALAAGVENADYHKILKSNDPDDAKKIAKSYNTQAAQKGWHSQNAAVMRKAVNAKVTQHADVRQVLLSTGDAPLLEHTVQYNDQIWGIGNDGKGQNLLGIILMEERAKLQP